MNNDACDDATNRTVSLKNEATPDATVFVDAIPSPNTAVAAGITAGTTLGGCLFVYEKKTFEVDALQNANKLT